MRYDVDGTLDPTFGTIVEPGLPTGSPPSVGVQPGGGVVVAVVDGTLRRYDSDGTPDLAFGTGGVAPGVGALHGRIAIQTDDKIVVAARDPGDTLLIARYTAGGMLDPGFGAGGIVATAITTYFATATLQPDGMILVASVGPTGTVFVRTDSSGVLDPGFGTGGVLAVPAGTTTFARQPDGKLVVTGGDSGAFPYYPRTVVTRFLSDGTPDPVFGTGGSVILPMGAAGVAPVVLGDGRLLVAGVARRSFYRPGPAMALRLEANGTIDPTFTVCGGAALTSFAGVTTDDLFGAVDVSDVADLGDGRFVMAGTSRPYGGGAKVVSLARFGSATPTPACMPDASGRSKIVAKPGPTGAPSRIKWKWTSGADVAVADFADPPAGGDLALCVLDATTGAFVQALTFSGGTTCPEEPCWRDTAASVSYKAQKMEVGGLLESPTLKAKAGIAGRAKFVYRDKGFSPNFIWDEWPVPFTTRMKTGDGSACWEATFSDVTLTGFPIPRLKALSD